MKTHHSTNCNTPNLRIAHYCLTDFESPAARKVRLGIPTQRFGTWEAAQKHYATIDKNTCTAQDAK